MEQFKQEHGDDPESPGEVSDDATDEDVTEDTASDEDTSGENADEDASDEETTQDSMLSQIASQDSPYEDPNAKIVPLLTRSEGIETGWVGCAHKNGLYFAQLHGRTSDLARTISNAVTSRLRAVDCHVGPMGTITTSPSGEPVEVGSLLDYTQSELDPGSENLGNLRLFTEVGGRLQPTNGRYNKHGQRLVNGLRKAYIEAADAETGPERESAAKTLAAYLRFIGYVFSDEVDVASEAFLAGSEIASKASAEDEAILSALEFTGVGVKGIALERAVMGETQPETAEEDEQEPFEQVA